MLPRTGSGAEGQNWTVRDCPWYWNPTSAVVWSAVDSTYMSFCFPGDIAAGYLFNSGNAYIVMSNDGTQDNNGACYSKEGLCFGSYAGPILDVRVPEPMTLSLLAAGALALIRRRK
jgi:hypothetical protein